PHFARQVALRGAPQLGQRHELLRSDHALSSSPRRPTAPRPAGRARQIPPDPRDTAPPEATHRAESPRTWWAPYTRGMAMGQPPAERAAAHGLEGAVRERSALAILAFGSRGVPVQ